jgi:hypothetical protein
MPFLTNLQSKDICASGNKCQLKYVKYTICGEPWVVKVFTVKVIVLSTNTDIKTQEIGQFHWNQGEEVAHFAWFGEPRHRSQCFTTKTPFWYCTCYWMNLEKQIQMPKYICTTPNTCQNCELRSSDPRLSVGKKSLCLIQGSYKS